MGGSQWPVGRVTLLFTDIEGSTRLIEELGEDGYVQALAEHRRLLREAFSLHRGVEVDTQGDAFLYAFADAGEALAAASDGQEALATAAVRVRMGLHTGELRLTGEGYAGRELHRAARISAAGHGGQVVVSATTRALVEGELTELGEHRLKDFSQPVALFQVGRERFPPLKTISNTNLPRPVSSFVGREREREELVSMLADGTRLVTLSGPGGSGKTRLAVEAATELVPEFKAGVFWVGLSALRDPALVTETIAQVLGAKDGLAEHIGERELLLLPDNFEQVVEAGPELATLLDACPNLKLLVTSRELLRIRGEVEYAVPPLAEPEGLQLFCERSRLEPDERIAELCRRLDELPLALELAAARTSVLSPAQILERLSQRLDLLKGGRDAEARQQTLRATIEWSHDLLDADEQLLFARLAVFRGGCTLGAAEEVADTNLDTLQSLVDKSLLRHTDERFWMLETIREFAVERLGESGRDGELRDRHADWILATAAAGWTGYYGHTSDEWLARMDVEFENVRAVLVWLAGAGRDAELAELVARSFIYWFARGMLGEAKRWLDVALQLERIPQRWHGTLLVDAFNMAMQAGDIPRAKLLAEQESAFFRGLGTPLGEVTALRDSGSVALASGELDRAAELLDEALGLGREIEYPDLAVVEVSRASVEIKRRDWERAEVLGRAAVATAERLGDRGIAVAGRSTLALALFGQGRVEDAKALLVEAFAGAVERRRTMLGEILDNLAAVADARGNHRDAARLLGRADEARREVGVGNEDDSADWLRTLTVAHVLEALGKDGFERGCEDGAELSLEAARKLVD